MEKEIGANARSGLTTGEYQMKQLAVGFTITDDYWEELTVTRMGWAWQAKKLKRAGYWIDGGIWPCLRFVRKARLDDYIYGKLGENKLRGLEGWIEDQK